MKKQFILLSILSLLLLGCSKDAEDTESQGTEVTKREFSFFINGEQLTLSVDQAYKDDNMIYLAPQGDNSLLKFTTDGKLGSLNTTVYEYGVERKFSNYYHFNSRFFNFELISYDAQNKRVKAQFSGYLYANADNLNSESKFVNGAFDLPVVELLVPLKGIGNKAKINNVNWESTRYYMKKEEPLNFHNITLHTLSNDEYKIMISFNRQLSSLGTYQFDKNAITEKVQLAKYNLDTNSYTFYNCSGTLAITQRALNTIRGTYHFTAVNPADPSDIMEITEGNYFLDYPPHQ